MTDTAPPKALTALQDRFCEEYLIDLMAGPAAGRAGYKSKRLDQMGYELLRKPEIGARIAELQSARSERTQITADRVLHELAAVAFTRFTDLASWNEDSLAFVPSHELTDAAARSVKSVKVKRTVVKGKDDYEQTTVETELTQHDKLSALDKLAKHLNLYGEQEKTGKSGLDALVEHMEKRRQERAAERAAAKDAE